MRILLRPLFTTLALGLMLCTPAHAAAAEGALVEPTIAACGARESAVKVGIQPSPDWGRITARAAWVDARQLRVAQAADEARQRAGARDWRLAHGDGLIEGLRLGQALGAGVSTRALSVVEGAAQRRALESPAGQATSHLGSGPLLTLSASPVDGPTDDDWLRRLHRGPMVLVGLDGQGRVQVAERVQAAQALDALFGQSAQFPALGVQVGSPGQPTQWAVWAPTARRVWLCLHGPRGEGVRALQALQREDHTGIWRGQIGRDLRGLTYRYLVEVWIPGQGWVRNRVTDPYSISLTADSAHSYVGSLDDPELAPPGWGQHLRPPAPASSVDMMISELHVRDFSASDRSVPAVHRGKYLAFTHSRSRGMQHLAAMASAGLTDLHLLPVFDLATVPERGCASPDERALQAAAPDATRQQALVQAMAARDCFNWGYDPWHFNAPEGSFATNARDPAVRIRELRQMVMALHGLGLRVGMDVVYNHMSASGQDPRSVLDRIVPGYYHRLNAQGEVERSTCCDNTATEHLMMRRLMIDSAVLWVRHHGIDSFRFDLMGHQPRDAMEALQSAVNQAAGRFIPLIGEGWNFGEIANGARFIQASQLSLAGSGIGTFNDRLRDAARGTQHGDDVAAMVNRKGWLNGAQGPALREAADLIRAGLVGSIRDFVMPLHDGRRLALRDLPYGGQPAGYVDEPAEVVNYVENHDNPTLFDLNAFKLPLQATARERAELQVLGSALVALAQGVAYWHAGQEILRSKSMDLNSYDSGDWFNRLDWTLRDNGFAAGLPPGQDSRPFWPLMASRLVHPGIKPSAEVIRFSRDAHLDLLRLRASTPLLRLPNAQAIRQRVSFPGTGPQHAGELIAMRIDGQGWAGSPHRAVMVLLNAGADPARLVLPEEAGQAWALHPVHRRADAADARIREQARWDAAEQRFSVPPRSAVVFVVMQP